MSFLNFGHWPVGRQLLLGPVFLGIVLTGTIAAHHASVADLQAVGRAVEQAHEIIGVARSVQQLVVDMETDQRGYLLTGDKQFLHSYRSAEPQLPEALSRLRALVRDPLQLRRLDQIDSAIQEWIERVIQDGTPPATEDGQELVISRADRGKLMVDRIRAEISSFIITEQGLLEARRTAERAAFGRAEQLLILALGATILAAFAAAAFLARTINRPLMSVAAAAQHVASHGLADPVVPSGGRELRALGETLNAMTTSIRNNQEELAARNEILAAQPHALETSNGELSPTQAELSENLQSLTAERERLKLLNEYSTNLASSLDPNAYCESVLDGLMALGEAQIGAVLRVQADEHVLEVGAARGISPQARAETRLAFGEGLAGRAAAERRLIVADTPDTAFSISVFNEKVAPACEAYLPLRFGEGVLGVVMLGRTKTAFSESELTVLHAAAVQAAIGLNNAQLYQELESRTEAQRELSEARAIYESAAINLVDGLAIMDRDDCVMFWNPRMEDLFGVSRTEAVGRSLWDVTALLYPRTPCLEQTTRESRQARDAAVAGEATTFEYQLSGDPPRDLLVLAFPIQGPDGLLGHGRLVRDVTREREVDRLKSELVSSVSHELRTPIAAILGFSELLLEREPLAEKSRRYVETIDHEARRLARLIDDFLDVQRIEAGNVQLRLQPLELRDVVQEVLTTVRPETSGHVLQQDLADDLPPVVADRDRLVQILHNLLSNAIKYSPDGGTIQINARTAGAMTEVTVTDEGLGVPEDALERLFEKFYRVDMSDRTRIGGTGLGLALCRDLIEAHGGQIWAESEGPGKGSTFRFTLPVAAVSAATETVRLPQLTIGHPAQPVLVVKDDQSFREYVETLLQTDGFGVLQVSTGEQALVVAEREMPRVIVLDVELAGKLDGWDVLAALRERPATARIPVLMISSRDERARGLALGASEYLVKPMPGNSLVAAVRRLGGPGTSTVLAVDDDPAMLEFASVTLTEQGYRVVQADNGAAALSLVQSLRPDLVLLDLLMPGLDGFGVLEALRDRPETRDIPVLVFSGKQLTSEDRVRLTDGVADVLTKQGIAAPSLADAVRAAVASSETSFRPVAYS